MGGDAATMRHMGTLDKPHTSRSAEMILTAQDVDRLLVDASVDSRVSVLERVSHHYNRNEFNPREREIAEQIFRLVMEDTMVTVREILAQRIQHNPSIPRDIVLHLAEDVELVALPILTHSQVFSDADLVSIVESSKEISKLLAISRRRYLGVRVGDALVESRYPEVIDSLLANEGAEISDHTYQKIVEDFHGNADVMQRMAQRRSLPMIVVERLMSYAGEAMAAHLREKYRLTDAQLRKDATSVRDDVLIYLLSHQVSEMEMLALVNKMHAEKRLNSSLVMTALCRGQLVFFTMAMAQLANISLQAAKQLIADKGELGFKRFYEKAHLPEAMFAASQLVLKAVKKLENTEAVPGSLLYANQLAEQVLSDMGDENIQYLPYFMALIRQAIQKH